MEIDMLIYLDSYKRLHGDTQTLKMHFNGHLDGESARQIWN